MQRSAPAVRACCAHLLLLLTSVCSPALAGPLRVGVTTHAYYSWTANVAAGTPVEIVPLLPDGADPHSFQPKAADLERLQRVDLLVVNGIGHDPFLARMLAAVGRADLPRVDLHRGVPLVSYQRGSGHAHGPDAPASPGQLNPHTFISLTTAIQQIYNLADGLAARLPEHKARLRRNARGYGRRLRKLKAWAGKQLLAAKATRVATVHDGYSYLLQELGLTVTAVIQPRHGIEPSAGELAKTIAAIRRTGVRIVFSELDFPRKYVELIRKETGVRVYPLSHVSRGTFTAGYFEATMRSNLETIIAALVEAPK